MWHTKWTVTGHEFIFTTIFSNQPDTYPAGEAFEDKILSVTIERWEMIEQSTAEINCGANAIEKLTAADIPV